MSVDFIIPDDDILDEEIIQPFDELSDDDEVEDGEGFETDYDPSDWN